MKRLVVIIGVIILFLILISSFYYSDFDSYLINQVEQNVSASKLIPQIDQQTQKMEINAKRHLQNIVMDEKMWGNGSLINKDEHQAYVSYYESEMREIADYDTLRKKFVKREITKREFIKGVEKIKQYFKTYS